MKLDWRDISFNIFFQDKKYFGELFLKHFHYLSKLVFQMSQRNQNVESNYPSLKYLKRPIKQLEHLFKNKNFWVGACSDQALNRTWAFIEKTKNKNKKCARQIYFYKNYNIASKIVHKSPFFPFAHISFQF